MNKQISYYSAWHMLSTQLNVHDTNDHENAIMIMVG